MEHFLKYVDFNKCMLRSCSNQDNCQISNEKKLNSIRVQNITRFMYISMRFKLKN